MPFCMNASDECPKKDQKLTYKFLAFGGEWDPIDGDYHYGQNKISLKGEFTHTSVRNFYAYAEFLDREGFLLYEAPLGHFIAPSPPSFTGTYSIKCILWIPKDAYRDNNSIEVKFRGG